MKRRIFLLAMISLVLLCMSSLAEGKAKPKATPELKPIEGPQKSQWPKLPELTQEGFLPLEGEFVHKDEEAGLWLYISEDINITICRYRDPNKPLIWFEADIRLQGDERLMAVLTNPEKPGRKYKYPHVLARENELVFAINDDFFGDRISGKRTPGIVLRNGQIIANKTHNSGNPYFPNLATMAFLPDGSIKVCDAKEHTAEEYLAMGAMDVFAFGPILVRDGKVNDQMVKKNSNLEPRTAIGMIEPLHYIVMVVEGRHKRSKGTGLPWIAEHMLALGVTQGFNLDGGQSSAMVFMAEKINKTGQYKDNTSARTLTSMIGVGKWKTEPEKN